MGSYINVYTDGGGIRKCPVPDDYSGIYGQPFNYRLNNFRRSLLASLIAGATASAVAGVVTITAAAHGVTTSSLYLGMRFYYPGSASLVAGWYDSITDIQTNTISFTVPGASFGSESVNGGIAVTTAIVFPAQLIVPANLLQAGSVVSVYLQRLGDNTATLKTSRLRYGGTILSAYASGTVSMVSMKHTFSCIEGSKQAGNNGAEGIVGSTYYNGTVDQAQNQVLDITGQLSAAQAFIAVENMKVEITI